MRVKVNDVELDLKPGTSAIDALFAAGYDVPYFCSQEFMSPIGACRMCLAKVGAPRKDKDGNWIPDEETGEPKIFFFPNLMATCTTAVMEGMFIDTLSQDVKDAQAGMVEFTLINHPLDCPTCDKGGACELQDRSYEYGSGISRFEFTKRHQEKHHPLSELITLDRERCIHCKRCVRYFEEIPGDEVLDFIERGSHTYIGTDEGGLPTYFSGNITDMCPVGALLDATSRFRGRNWEYDHTRTTCMDCPVGCSTTVDARTGRIERVKGARNIQVNNDWLCDGGRFGHEYVDAPDRIKTPMIRQNGVLMPVTWEAAAMFIRRRLENLGSPEMGVAIKADATVEEGVAAKAIAQLFGTANLDHAPRPVASVIPPGKQATLTDVATADAILVIGDLTEEAPIVDLRIKEALKGVTPPELLPHGVPLADLRLKERMPRKKEILGVVAPYQVDLMKHAGHSVQYPAGKEAAFLKSLMKQDEFVADFKNAKNAVVIYGAFVLASEEATAAANAFAEAVGAKVMAVGPMANSYGLEAIRVLPENGKGYREMLDGSVQALFLSGLNPALESGVAETLKNAELLIVHDTFPSKTTELAHVVLPAKTNYEKEGTTVNIEGRYLMVNAAPVDGGLAEDLLGVAKFLGDAYGTRLEGRSLRSAHRELKKQYGLELSELPLEGFRPETAGEAKAATKAKGKAKKVSGNLLLVPSMLRPERLDRNPHLLANFGDVSLRLNPADAAKHKLQEGARVEFTAGGVKRLATVYLTDTVSEGLMLLPALPEQGVGLVELDLTTLTLQRIPLEVSA